MKKRPTFAILACLAVVACGSDPAERRAGVYDLVADPTDENVEALRALLADSDRDVRATALNSFVGLRPPDAASVALAALDDTDAFVRATAAKLIGDLGDPVHADPLSRRLAEDPDPVVRQRAAEALGVLGGERALSGLVRGLADPMERVRQVSVEGLRRQNPAFAVPQLMTLLRDDSAWEVRVQAARALGLTGDPEVVAPLEAALDDPNEFVRSAASNALGTFEELEARRGGGPGDPP